MADLDTVLRALRAPARREILTLIWDRDLPAGEIAAAFSLSAATISEHLAVLRRAGLVDMTQVGTSRRYRARPEALEGLHGALEGASKWVPATDLAERALTDTSAHGVVVAGGGVTTDHPPTAGWGRRSTSRPTSSRRSGRSPIRSSTHAGWVRRSRSSTGGSQRRW